LGLGAEFEKGFEAAGRLLLCMTGFLALAPVIARMFSPVVVPLLRGVEIDLSMFAGILFVNDSGGAALASELADNPDMGRFSGQIVGSMLGTTVMFNIPLCIAGTRQEQHPAVVYGLLAGIITTPLGCLAGGLAAGFELNIVLWNMIPVLLISGVLALMLILCRELIVRLLTMLRKGILALGAVGLIVIAVQELTGVIILEGMTSLDEIFIIIGNICIFLAGIFPLLSVFSLLAEMDDKGRMLNVAFLVSGSCLLGDHLAYAAQVDPAICGPMLVGKLIGGLSAVLLALLLAPRLLEWKP
jgi:ethanolamine transporter